MKIFFVDVVAERKRAQTMVVVVVAVVVALEKNGHLFWYSIGSYNMDGGLPPVRLEE